MYYRYIVIFVLHLHSILMLVQVGEHEAVESPDIAGEELDVIGVSNGVDADELLTTAAGGADDVELCEELVRLVLHLPCVSCYLHHRV